MRQALAAALVLAALSTFGDLGPNYAYHFAAWTFAFLPGFLALLIKTAKPQKSNLTRESP